jgi:hypothetical protein
VRVPHAGLNFWMESVSTEPSNFKGTWKVWVKVAAEAIPNEARQRVDRRNFILKILAVFNCFYK